MQVHGWQQIDFRNHFNSRIVAMIEEPIASLTDKLALWDVFSYVCGPPLDRSCNCRAPA